MLGQGFGLYHERARRVFSQPDRGIYDAMNEGIRKASGKYIMFLNADDRFYGSDVLDKIVHRLEASPHIDFWCGNVCFEKNFKFTRYVCAPRNFNIFSFKAGFFLPHPGSVIKRKVLLEVGMFNLNFPICGDLELMWKIASNNSSYRSLSLDTTIMSLGGVSTQGARSYYQISKEIIQLTNVESNFFWKAVIWLRGIFKLPELIRGYLKPNSCFEMV